MSRQMVWSRCIVNDDFKDEILFFRPSKEVSKVTGATSSEGFLVLITDCDDVCRFLNVSIDYQHNGDELQQLQCVMDDYSS